MKLKLHAVSVLMLLSIFFGVMRLSAEVVPPQAVDHWLILGPLPISNTEVKLLDDETGILHYPHIPLSSLRPTAGEKFDWMGDQTFQWQVLADAEIAAPPSHQIVYLATFLENRRFLKTKFCLNEMTAPFIVHLDGKAQKTDKEADDPERAFKDCWSCRLDLVPGKHTLLIKALLKKGEPLHLKSFLLNQKAVADAEIRVSLDPGQLLAEGHILNMKRIRGIELSPDGSKVAISLSQTMPDNGKENHWLEILDTANGGVLLSSENLGLLNDVRWLSDSARFSYTLDHKGKTSLYLFHLKTRKQSCLRKNIENFGSYWWAPDDSYLIYSIYSRDKNKEGVRHFKEITDRTDWSGYRYSLYIFYPKGRVAHPLTGEEDNYNSIRISPDSRKLLLIKSRDDYENRPYSITSVHLMNLRDFSSRPLLEGNWIDRVEWAPDAGQLLVIGGPSAFEGIGNTLPPEGIPNDYDKQAFLADLNGEGIEPITRSFDPSIAAAFWNPVDKNIYFRVAEQAFIRLYRYAPGKKSFRRLDTGVEVISRIAFAGRGNTAVYWGCSSADPHKLYRMDLDTGKTRLLKDYNAEAFRHVRLGRTEDWNFQTPEGKTISGRLYFPPDFDPAQKYPCIVYYYGGTSPVIRDFGGRYPKNWYAANGYLVYVLQPSGAVGFGQANSALHVNDWGKVTTQEIIAGVKELVRTHPYIDAGRIGAIGASYGGFLTQSLAARTDLFAAYISHAGITTLSSYWGVGDWGYTYSGIASAGSFPWNRKDVYVDQSPLFMADRIKHPLLLLHGTDDNNVPPGESYQMFTALKLLGKEVALVTFPGQKHHILEFKKRLQWMRTIIAWFDKWLKNRPEYWDHLYSDR